MNKGRLEAFSDGVIAIIITIMVLELKIPQGTDLSALQPLMPVFFAYVLSFVHVGIYWNNHHHLLHIAEKVNGAVLWANLHLLFWLSLTPVVAAWMGPHYRDPWPVATYGFILFMSSNAYYILVRCLLKLHGPDSLIGKAIKRDFKGKLSTFLYLVAMPLAFISPWLSLGCYVTVSVMWFVPDRRVEKVLQKGRDLV